MESVNGPLGVLCRRPVVVSVQIIAATVRLAGGRRRRGRINGPVRNCGEPNLIRIFTARWTTLTLCYGRRHPWSKAYLQRSISVLILLFYIFPTHPTCVCKALKDDLLGKWLSNSDAEFCLDRTHLIDLRLAETQLRRLLDGFLKAHWSPW